MRRTLKRTAERRTGRSRTLKMSNLPLLPEAILWRGRQPQACPAWAPDPICSNLHRVSRRCNEHACIVSIMASIIPSTEAKGAAHVGDTPPRAAVSRSPLGHGLWLSGMLMMACLSCHSRSALLQPTYAILPLDVCTGLCTGP